MVSKHMTKEEIREDRVVTAVIRIAEYIRENVTRIIVTAAVLVVAVSAILIVSSSRMNAERAAAAELLEAKSFYFANDYVTASAQFKDLADRRGSSRAAREARLFHANSELALGNAAAAEALYRTFLSSDAARDAVMKAAGLRGLGAALAAQRRFQEAAVEYSNAASTPGSALAPDDLLQAALLSRRAGDVPAAIEALRKLLDAYPASQIAGEARVRLQEFEAIR